MSNIFAFPIKRLILTYVSTLFIYETFISTWLRGITFDIFIIDFIALAVIWFITFELLITKVDEMSYLRRDYIENI